ncbi:MAG: putative lipid II flippase FtsW [Spirochaetes bacterium]|nr:putative lipid II flippase FtsW [Spirochaetota bacterium]
MYLKSMSSLKRGGEVDLVYFLTIFIISGFGLAMIYSASAVHALKAYGDSLFFLKKQLAWVCTGFFILFVFQSINYRVYFKYTKIMLLASFVMLIILLIPGVGQSINGSVRWLGFRNLSIQPSEFVKIFIVIYLVKVFTWTSDKINRVLQLLIPILVISAVFLLILMQPDFGTAADLLIVSGILFFVSGFSIISILSLSVLSIPMFYLLIYQVDYRKDRIMAFLDPWQERFGNGYHIIQSFIAFKKGGLFGAGLGLGTQKIKRLPEPHTDFIFAVIAEEAGLLGTVLIVVLFCILFWRGLYIALHVSDRAGSLLAIALTIMIVIQAFINIGVVIGSLPTTGIPLPMISYGGSSFISSMIALGIVLNISKSMNAENEDFAFNEGNLQYE